MLSWNLPKFNGRNNTQPIFLTYPSPVQGAREVIAGAQRHDGNRRGRFNAQAVDFGQDPANSSITPTGQDSQVRHFLVQLKSKRYKINKLTILMYSKMYIPQQNFGMRYYIDIFLYLTNFSGRYYFRIFFQFHNNLRYIIV